MGNGCAGPPVDSGVFSLNRGRCLTQDELAQQNIASQNSWTFTVATFVGGGALAGYALSDGSLLASALGAGVGAILLANAMFRNF